MMLMVVIYSSLLVPVKTSETCALYTDASGNISYGGVAQPEAIVFSAGVCEFGTDTVCLGGAMSGTTTLCLNQNSAQEFFICDCSTTPLMIAMCKHYTTNPAILIGQTLLGNKIVISPSYTDPIQIGGVDTTGCAGIRVGGSTIRMQSYQTCGACVAVTQAGCAIIQGCCGDATHHGCDALICGGGTTSTSGSYHGGNVLICGGAHGGTNGGNILLNTYDEGGMTLNAATGKICLTNTNSSTTNAFYLDSQCAQISSYNIAAGTQFTYANFNGNGTNGPDITMSVLSGGTSSASICFEHYRQTAFGCSSNYQGIVYCADFSGNYTNRSLVDCAYVASQVSDVRLKCCLEPISASVDALCGYSFKFNEITKCDNCCAYGFIAQEVEKIFPFAVKDDSREIDGVCYKGIDYVQLVPVLWNIVREQESRIKLLEDKLNT